VNLVSFTGGTVTGKRVGAAAIASFKKLSLELGGKNATIGTSIFCIVCDEMGESQEHFILLQCLMIAISMRLWKAFFELRF
jgi:hypothetical protein